MFPRLVRGFLFWDHEMDLTLAVIGVPLNQNASYTIGDIVDILPSQSVATLSGSGNYEMFRGKGHPACVFIHVRNCPDYPIERYIDRLCSEVLDVQNVGGENRLTTVRKRKFSIPLSLVPQNIINTLNANKEVTFQFSTVRSYLKKKQVINNQDRSQDVLVDFADTDIQ